MSPGDDAPSSSKTRPRRSSRLIWAGSALLTLFVLLVIWVGLLAFQAYRISSTARELEARVAAARADVHQQDSSQTAIAKLADDLAAVQRQGRQLQDRTNGVLWRSGRFLPGLSGSVQETADIADIAAGLSKSVLPAYLDLARAAPDLKTANGDINIALLQRQVAPVTAATARLDRLVTQLERVQPHGIRALDNGRTKLLDSMTSLQSYGRSATTTLQVAPPLLGATKPATILVVLESPAESRAGGGLVGGYVLLRADHGHIAMVESGTNHDLKPTATPVISLGKQYDAIYTNLSGRQNWIDSNLSPDFPKTGALWTALFHAQSGTTPDAVLGVTPAVLDDLLAVTGPVRLPDGQVVKSGEVNRFLQIGLYAKFPTDADETARNAYQLAFLQDTISAVIADHADPTRLLRKLGPRVDAGALRLHVTDPKAQDLVAATPLGGALTTASQPYFGVFTNSTDGTKIDPYLTKKITYHRSAPTRGQQQVTVTYDVTNNAPTTGLPPYVATHDYIPPRPDTPEGSHQFIIAVYLATGATNPVVTLDGKPTKPLFVGREQDHLLVWVQPPPLDGGGARETVSVAATEPASASPPSYLEQPSLVPTTYTILPAG